MIDSIFKFLFNKSYNEATGFKDIFEFRLRIINECDLLNSIIHESSEENWDFKFKSERLARKGHSAFNYSLITYIQEVFSKSAESNSRSESEEEFFNLVSNSA